jgi:FG-GAP-like repeat
MVEARRYASWLVACAGAAGSVSGCAGGCEPTGSEPTGAASATQTITDGSTSSQADEPSSGGALVPDVGDDGPAQPLPPEIPPLGEGCSDGVPATGEFCYVRVEIGELGGSGVGRSSFAIDLDGDGRASFGIATSNANGSAIEHSVTMAHLRGDGSFTLDPTMPSVEWWAEWTDRDFDGDGRRDVVGVVEIPDSNPALYVHRSLGDTLGELETRSVIEPGGTWVGFPIDVEGDDVFEAVVGIEFEGARLRRRQGSQWLDVGPVLPLPSCNWLSGSAHADFNEDGFEDVVTTGGTQACDPYPGTYDPSWHRVAVFFSDPVGGLLVAGPELPMGGVHQSAADKNHDLFAGDFDTDGHADILIPLQDHATGKRVGTSFLRGRGDGSFEEAVVVDIEETEGYVVGRAGDFDGDGVLDLLGGRVVAEPALTEIVVARGPWPTLSFDVIAVVDRSGVFTLGDVNGDGVSDLLMTDASLSSTGSLEPRRTYFFALLSSP